MNHSEHIDDKNCHCYSCCYIGPTGPRGDIGLRGDR